MERGLLPPTLVGLWCHTLNCCSLQESDWFLQSKHLGVCRLGVGTSFSIYSLIVCSLVPSSAFPECVNVPGTTGKKIFGCIFDPKCLRSDLRASGSKILPEGSCPQTLLAVVCFHTQQLFGPTTLKYFLPSLQQDLASLSVFRDSRSWWNTSAPTDESIVDWHLAIDHRRTNSCHYVQTCC